MTGELLERALGRDEREHRHTSHTQDFFIFSLSFSLMNSVRVYRNIDSSPLLSLRTDALLQFTSGIPFPDLPPIGLLGWDQGFHKSNMAAQQIPSKWSLPFYAEGATTPTRRLSATLQPGMQLYLNVRLHGGICRRMIAQVTMLDDPASVPVDWFAEFEGHERESGLVCSCGGFMAEAECIRYFGGRHGQKLRAVGYAQCDDRDKADVAGLWDMTLELSYKMENTPILIGCQRLEEHGPYREALRGAFHQHQQGDIDDDEMLQGI